MKEEKFKILQFTRELILVVENELENFPKKDIEIKNKLRMNSYDVLEFMYEANITEDNDKKVDLLEKSIAKIKIIDFLVNMSYDRKLITQKRYLKLGEKMDDIVKYISGLLKKCRQSRA